MLCEDFDRMPFMGILRGISPQDIAPLTEAVIRSRLKTIEITMNTPQASALINSMITHAKGNLTIGAGTVVSMDDLHTALDAGASFIVSPTYIPSIVEYCVRHKIPVFPGALTPQEISTAMNAGATMVKVFPAKLFGASYFKDLRGPFPNLKLLACGGIRTNTVASYFSSGANAVAFGASIFKTDYIADGEFNKITSGINELINAGAK